MYGYTWCTYHELWKKNMWLHHSIQYNKMECRHYSLSTFRCVDVLVCQRFGLSTFWFVDFLVCRRFGLSTFQFVDVSVCRRFGLSTFWLVTFPFVDVLTSNRLEYIQRRIALQTTNAICPTLMHWMTMSFVIEGWMAYSQGTPWSNTFGV